jgi:hypothetical protein
MRRTRRNLGVSAMAGGVERRTSQSAKFELTVGSQDHGGTSR